MSKLVKDFVINLTNFFDFTYVGQHITDWPEENAQPPIVTNFFLSAVDWITLRDDLNLNLEGSCKLQSRIQ